MADFVWKESLACVATYKVLEGDTFLDQFEEKDIAFKDAASVKLGSLRYYPATTDNSDIIKLLALEIARRFVKLLTKTYTVTKEDHQATSASIIQAIAKVFGDKDKTIKDLAKVVDDKIHFSDEG